MLAVVLVIGANSGRDAVEHTGDGQVPALPSAAAQAVTELIVTNVIDGDTLKLSDGRTVRVLGIDTPEAGECGYEQAREFARATLLDEQVEVASDPTQDTVDRYGRALLYVARGGVDYSHAVVTAGWAEHLVVGGVPVEKAEILQAAQAAAREAKLGIWGQPCTRSTRASPNSTHRAQPPTKRDGDADIKRPVAPAAAAPEREPGPAAPPTPRPVSEPSGRDCHPSYVPCVPDSIRDLNCKDVGHRVKVVGPDEYRLDGDDNDGKGCESYPPA
ncbi:MAG: thermonuclease family protein [Pseudonocardia sp.]|nr:thermonuclease family protein [Pseudonocardia sp.]